eukprot:3251703-Rhodomonas_salina.1
MREPHSPAERVGRQGFLAEPDLLAALLRKRAHSCPRAQHLGREGCERVEGVERAARVGLQHCRLDQHQQRADGDLGRGRRGVSAWR